MWVVNLLGEPGCGKSVTAAGVFHTLAINGFQAELVQEVAKAYAWETPKDKDGDLLVHPIFKQQVYLLADQNRSLERLRGKREVAISECPLIMNMVYAPKNYLPSFKSIVLEQFNSYQNINILLQRNHDFDSEGRIHNESQAHGVREELVNILEENNIDYVVMKTHKKISEEISLYIRDNYFPHHKLDF